MRRWRKPRTRWIRSTPAGPSWRKRRTELLSLCRSAPVIAIRSGCETEGYDRFSAGSRAVFEFFQHVRFEVARVGRHFAGGNLLVRGAVVAEFANAQALCGADRRPKNAAGHGARFVQFAVPCSRVKRGARLIVRKL